MSKTGRTRSGEVSAAPLAAAGAAWKRARRAAHVRKGLASRGPLVPRLQLGRSCGATERHRIAERTGACAPFQFGLSTRAGAEAVAHALSVATELDPDATVLSVDGIGAFDTVSRQAMLHALRHVPAVGLLKGNHAAEALRRLGVLGLAPGPGRP